MTAQLPFTPAETGPAPSLTVTPLSPDPLGPRIATSHATPLVVGAAPIEAASLLLSYGALASGAYVLVGVDGEGVPAVRVGESLGLGARIGEHLRAPPLAIETLVLVGSTGRIGRHESCVLESLLFTFAEASPLALVGRTPGPAPRATCEPGLAGRWHRDLAPLLASVAGPLVARAAQDTPIRGTSGASTTAAAMAPPRPASRADGVRDIARAGAKDAAPCNENGPARWVLHHDAARAEAIVVGGQAVLLRGSTLVAEAQRDCKAYVVRCRERLIGTGVAVRLPDGTLRLVRDLVLPSLTYAGRVVTGKRRVPGWESPDAQSERAVAGRF